MKQSENPEAFFEKYGFRMTISQKHPTHKDSMHFEGLEADYVATLEREVKECRKYIQQQAEKMDWLRDREFLCWKAGKNE